MTRALVSLDISDAAAVLAMVVEVKAQDAQAAATKATAVIALANGIANAAAGERDAFLEPALPMAPAKPTRGRPRKPRQTEIQVPPASGVAP